MKRFPSDWDYWKRDAISPRRAYWRFDGADRRYRKTRRWKYHFIPF